MVTQKKYDRLKAMLIAQRKKNALLEASDPNDARTNGKIVFNGEWTTYWSETSISINFNSKNPTIVKDPDLKTAFSMIISKHLVSLGVSQDAIGKTATNVNSANFSVNIEDSGKSREQLKVIIDKLTERSLEL